MPISPLTELRREIHSLIEFIIEEIQLRFKRSSNPHHIYYRLSLVDELILLRKMHGELWAAENGRHKEFPETLRYSLSLDLEAVYSGCLNTVNFENKNLPLMLRERDKFCSMFE